MKNYIIRISKRKGSIERMLSQLISWEKTGRRNLSCHNHHQGWSQTT